MIGSPDRRDAQRRRMRLATDAANCTSGSRARSEHPANRDVAALEVGTLDVAAQRAGALAALRREFDTEVRRVNRTMRPTVAV